jgi:hypothetical protein
MRNANVYTVHVDDMLLNFMIFLLYIVNVNIKKLFPQLVKKVKWCIGIVAGLHSIGKVLGICLALHGIAKNRNKIVIPTN